ncbi:MULTISPECIES: LacI family DNA-binding transcriptional regulator [unclassified Actinomyces]|uniref:LacI family DNA-binding transcriptional regulator n=1 Tax=unclassified Actinomyces TaxID=2609248 RepID=UPI000D59DF9C|nr:MULTISPECIES: LacI family DNA-binding transcriptional regulator [unclassified Actinomyces]RAX22773.1 LacI family DNA-binding transcriptional regulator [Actinomyces sp. Z5]RAX23431.1 LacI family DNA-binding transcriptional regulator [Actinomyces sp. Z3]
MTTLAEVADAANVSTASASLVLSGKAKGRVSEATAARVRAAAEDLGYVRDALAGGMRNRRTHTVGVLGENVLSTPYAVAMIDAILTASRELGWSVLLTDSGGAPEQSRRAVRELRSRRVDVIVHAAMYHQQVHVPPELANVAVLNGFADRDDVVGVVPDEAAAANTAVTHLLELGHRRIGHITHDDSTVAIGLRHTAYENTLRAAGITPDPSLIIRGGNDPEGADASAWRLLDRADPPTAVFCYNDGIAAGVYRVAAALGLSIPDDLSVVGFDDLKLISTNLAPRLTTMRLPHYEMADWLVRHLIAGDLPTPATTHRCQCDLIVRGSTAPASA